MNITEYFNVDVCNYASYDNYRKIASVVDGLKPSSRKCMYTVMKNNVSAPKKVSTLKSEAAAQTQYLHGDQSLEGVIVTLAQDFVGSNNLPLLKREGAFGTRLIPSAAAGRYIFTCKEDYLDKVFKKEDEPILIEQVFEGSVIEPKFYLPVIPLLVVNGNIGLTMGFTQRILQHNPKDVIQYIKAKLDGSKKLPKLKPWFKGFIGSIYESKEKGEGNWVIEGKVDVVGPNELEITELPINYTLATYINVLDELEDEKLIKDYRDLSDDGKFKFRVRLNRNGTGITAKDKDLLSKFKLISTFTEHYTSFDENNKLVEFKSLSELIDYYFDVRLKFYDLRKNWLIDDFTKKIVELVSKYVFINGVVDGSIIISKKSDKEIVKQLEQNEKIVKLNGSYDYLLMLPMRSMTKEVLEKQKKQLLQMKKDLEEVKKTSIEDMWKEDLKELEEVLK